MAKVLSTEQRVAVVTALVEGNSLRATTRITGVARNTVNKLLLDLGTACSAFQNEAIAAVTTKRIQADEIWSFVGAKAKNVPEERQGELGIGDVWTYVAIDADTKLCLSFLVGHRNADTATVFLQDVASRIANRVQLTTDGHKMYLDAVETAFGGGVDYAMLHKVYGAPREGHERYSPAKCYGTKRARIQGSPDPRHVSTSYVERQNLTMRMSIRRFTRLTNAFSKALEQHAASISLHFAYVNWCRIHGTLKTTPAVAAGLAEKPWTIQQLIDLLPATVHTGGRPRKTN